MDLQDIYELDEPVQDAVMMLHQLNIITNSSEGGGTECHGAPDFSYVEAKLSKDNIRICQKYHFLLNKIYSRNGRGDLLFNGSALKYGTLTGFYIIGIFRKHLTDEQVKEKFNFLIKRLNTQ